MKTSKNLFLERFNLHLKGEPTQEIKNWVKFACEKNNVPDLADKITIRFNFRLTEKMGRAWGEFCHKHINLIELSEPLWFLQSKEEQKETAIHEACHIIVDHIAKKNGQKRPKGHGQIWQKAMRNCGVKPERCYSSDISRKREELGIKRKVQRFPAYCLCGTQKISKHLRTKMLRGNRYNCLDCGSGILLNKH